MDCSYNPNKSWSENLETHQHLAEGKARRAGEKLDKLKARPDTGTQLDQLRDGEIAQHEAELKRHAEHAAAAKQGYVLEDTDPAWQFEHQALRAEAGRRGRLHDDGKSDHDDGQPTPLLARKGGTFTPGAPTS